MYGVGHGAFELFGMISFTNIGNLINFYKINKKDLTEISND